jgi:hypothetical protein
MRALVLIFTLASSAPAMAHFQVDLMKGKTGRGSSSSSSEGVQWTLADWLSQKNKMSLADQWLAMHRGKSSFDFNASASHNRYWVRTTDANGNVTTTSRDAQNYTADLGVSIFSIHGEYEKNTANEEIFGGSAGLRLLGAVAQTTSLTARYGFIRRQSLTTGERWDNPIAEGQLQLYIFRTFGLNGEYRYYFPVNSNLGNRLQGHRVTAGAFIENGYFRIYGNYYVEPMQSGPTTSATQDRREGYEAGVRLYF